MTVDGEDDGFEILAAFHGSTDPSGNTRLLISCPPSDLARVHTELVMGLRAPLSVLYRQSVNRKNPQPNGSPPRDFVGLEQPTQAVLEALSECAALVYHDARCEVWIRGCQGEQLVLDTDGLVYLYPDGPGFREILKHLEIPDRPVESIADRDYVKHWFHMENDTLETRLLEALRLQEVPHRG